MSAQSAEPSTLIGLKGSVGRITLNRPDALNALNMDMVRAMTEALTVWRDDEAVKAVVVDGAGEKAFCAGGDIRMLIDSGRAQNGGAEIFWSEEYALNTLIKRYPKPYVALMDGVTMGGGVGVSVHGSFRVATERTLFAMPETGIGFYPDVGGTYFLPRLPGKLGMWMALTGARLKGADTLAAGLATHFVPAERIAALIAALESEPLDDEGAVVDDIVHAHETDPGASALAEHRAAIDAAFGGESVEAIVAALDADGGAWAHKQRDILAQKSPTSLKVTFRALAEGAVCEFEEAMRRELALSVRFVDDGSDFYEGVRAVIIDKDQAPQWTPDRLDAVDDAMVERFFTARNEGQTSFESQGESLG